MGRSLRLFVAIDPDAGTRTSLAEDLAGARNELPRGWRWVRAAGIHLTLRFLGETEAGRVDDLESSLAHVAADTEPFELALSREWGAFPNARRARVLWRALSGDLPALRELAGSLEGWARACGYEAEERAFRPHLTLARADRRSKPGPVDLRRLPASGGEPFQVDAVVLYRSELGEGGARYEALGRAPLGVGQDKAEELS